MVLGLSDAVEGAHMGHPDFRVQNRIFASLNAEQTIGTVKLAPDEQGRFVAIDSTVFVPASGAWGLQGWTKVHLATADHEAVGEALTSAWQLMQAKGPSKKSARAAASSSARASKTSPDRQTAKPGVARKATSRPATAPATKPIASTKAKAASRAVINDHIAACAPNVRTIMKAVRAMIRQEVPTAGEKISYGMPAFELDGILICYEAFKNHLGIFPPVKGDAALSKALAKYRGEKGSLRFSFDEPMPYPLIRRVVQARLKEHLARRAAKRKKR